MPRKRSQPRSPGGPDRFPPPPRLCNVRTIKDAYLMQVPAKGCRLRQELHLATDELPDHLARRARAEVGEGFDDHPGGGLGQVAPLECRCRQIDCSGIAETRQRLE